ncbi:GNAT family N-acetyltransferase [Vibrio parahaemolyticus]|uniref:GNAT family N-acetyltransferase n=1 Tax=Vibrio parahaemolyticus TaxID=670 RepID=UPI00046FECBC|nr:GNAT family N-acetyltransferase [Vibrio parahaemolyticus]EJG1707960.1 GNAT family N-acetyltransferase [Vibrio parahaemolyticus]EJG1740470.1 GNAT family N-acetyltransferase [Vibrio parahaemolyticus]EJG1780319.1 GNAT family N-acetyltransferase [Vibrio parahaemolyticus]MDZ5177203.1 GNAT family N-acetyltransferase [Vibrio parahaemolyticus]SUP24038.1 histone acetyltransferase HPA2 [Vibrio parahaemolyticus]
MEIILSKFKKHEHSSAFDDFKLYMKPIVESAVGWDESFQRTSFESKLEPEWFSWIICNGEKVGYVCSRLKSSSIHIHLLIIYTDSQRKGFGSTVIQKLKQQANLQQLDLTLSCFKSNEPAARMYKRLEFVTDSEDEFFYNFISAAEST